MHSVDPLWGSSSKSDQDRSRALQKVAVDGMCFWLLGYPGFRCAFKQTALTNRSGEEISKIVVRRDNQCFTKRKWKLDSIVRTQLRSHKSERRRSQTVPQALQRNIFYRTNVWLNMIIKSSAQTHSRTLIPVIHHVQFGVYHSNRH